MPTYAEAIADIGATQVPGTDLIVAIMDGTSIRHFPLDAIRDEPITRSAHVYLAGGGFEPGSVKEYEGRKKENVRSVLWLQFDADLADYSGIPLEDLHQMPQSDIDHWIEAQRADLTGILTELGIRIHRIDYTGYGLCAYMYIEPGICKDLPTMRTAHKTFIKAINQRAGIKLVDSSASDAGTRISRIPGSYNVKNPLIPRQVQTLWYDQGRYVSLDTIKFALKRADSMPAPTPLPQRTTMPASIAHEIIDAVQPHWNLGQKHKLALALSGMLAKAGLSEDQTLSIIEKLSEGDQAPIDRERCVRDTYARLRAGQDNQGFMSLREMLPDTTLAYITQRLDQVKSASVESTGVFTHNATKTTGKAEDIFASSLDVSPLPDICYHGWIGKYTEMMLPLSEAPAQFHVASGMGLIGASTGRTVSNYHTSSDIFPNTYFMVVGIAGYSRKDTAIRFAVNMPKHRSRMSHVEAPFKILTDVGSPQGLLEQLQKHSNIWLYVTEYERLAANAHRSATSAIFPTLTALFDTPPSIENVTKGNPIEAKFPFLSVIAAVQPDILSTHMLPEDISNGFATRWLYVPGNGGEPIPSPPNLNEGDAGDLYRELMANITRYQRQDGRTSRLQFSDEATKRWNDWYLADRRASLASTSDDEASMRSRLGVHIRKIALIYAIGDGAVKEITLQHLDAAIAFVEWCWRHTREMLKSWGVSPTNQIEVRIEKVLGTHGPMKRRDLQIKSRHRKWGATDFAKVLEAMIRNGTVEVDPEGMLALSR